MPLDNRPYCGGDPRFKNLFWFTGLGGRGMSIAPALASELSDLLMTGKNKLLDDHFSPARALNPNPSPIRAERT
jgi:glycine/D-amino acid oxidase-like deaminating enzyme